MSQQYQTARRTLTTELKQLQAEPLEGFIVQPDERNIFNWNVAIFGPPGTVYQGGYFKANLSFPYNYPFAPPTFKFLSDVWHPNVYTSGKICISILQQTGINYTNEKWNPTQSVRTILLSIISLLSEPNLSSPANSEASAMYKKWKDGINEEYSNYIKRLVAVSKKEARKDNVVVPETVEQYCVKSKLPEVEYLEEPETNDYDMNYDYVEDDDDEDGEEEEEEEKEKDVKTTAEK